MNPIPAWVRRLWNVWDLRVLVLLSFTLQIILSIFGSRRKYIPSLWISVLVWSAYLTADWVATVALGKLSDVQGNDEKTNVLWATWAPILLLHLGGPNSITAYSLEDNQLWLRHLLGLVVQLFVAIYVILLSWENSWFSFMSLPALVAGIIKYGERTWVLKSVSAGNYIDIIPFGDLVLTGDLTPYYDRIRAHEYVRVLILAQTHLRAFMIYLGGRKMKKWDFRPHFLWVSEDNIGCDAVEVSMGLMYDLLYTKATKIFSKGGLILRCISFGCTVIVSVGLIFRIALLKRTSEEDEIDMAITGVLILGALALEIYAAIEIFSSNWFMLWLIKQDRLLSKKKQDRREPDQKQDRLEWVTWLYQRFPWLFHKEKSWSKMMGRFDLLDYCVEHNRERNVLSSLIRSVLGRDYELKWNRYRHTTAYPVHPLVFNAISDYYKAQSSSTNSDELRARDHELAKFREILEDTNPPPEWKSEDDEFPRGKFLGLHLATEICYHLENEWDDAGDNPSGSDSSSSSKEVCKVVSDYIMYLLVMHPSLLPDDGSRYSLEMVLDGRRPSWWFVWKKQDKKEACCVLLEREATLVWSRVAEGLKGMGKVKRWEILKQMWLDLVRDASVSSPTAHFQRLRQGGEFLTLMWFLSLHSRNLPAWMGAIKTGRGGDEDPGNYNFFCYPLVDYNYFNKSPGL